MPEPMRIEKYLSEAGLASRREAQALIKAGLVFINGKAMRATGLKIDPIKDKVELHSEAKKMSDRRETVAIYKPRGVVSSKDTDEGVKTVFDIFPQYKHLNTVGRLDKESEGLLLLSNDGLITKAITGKDHLIEKEYIVTVREDVLPVHMKKMSEGMKLADGMTLPAHAEKIDKHTFTIALREGRKHQIRRMSDACKLTVMSLKRLRIGSITLRSMRAGQARVLTEKDINQLKNILHEGF